MANTYLTHTTSTPTNSDKATLSFWLKRSLLSSGRGVFAEDTNGTNKFAFILDSSDRISIFQETGGTVDINLVTNRKFRDTSAWYHIVIAYDSSQGSASDRVKIYVNGSQETSFSTSTYPSSNVDFRFNKSGIVQEIGRYEGGNYFDGLLSHINFIDGTAYAASAFGSTDTTTGEWKIKTSPSVTYGTNGFFILKDGNSVTDASTNSNNFSVAGGTLTKTEDNPSNVFATLNVLASTSTPNFSNGNTSIYANTQNSWNQLTPATFVMPSGGKFYWEVKNTSSSHPNYINPGFMNANYYNNLLANSGFPGNVYDADNGFWNGMQGGGDNNTYAVYRAGTASNINISESFLNGDILSFAVDLNNRKAWLGKNGTYIQSGNPSNGTNETWSSADIDANTDYVPGIGHYYTNPSASFNFGNGYFGTTAVSSAGTNASGIGIFEYDVPTGFTALSTKGLNL